MVFCLPFKFSHCDLGETFRQNELVKVTFYFGSGRAIRSQSFLLLLLRKATRKDFHCYPSRKNFVESDIFVYIVSIPKILYVAGNPPMVGSIIARHYNNICTNSLQNHFALF